MDDLGGDAVVEAGAPGRRAERIAVGVDAPESVVLAFGEVAQAHAPVGGVHEGVAEVVVPQIPAELEERGEGGVADPGGGGEVARGDVDVAVDVAERIGPGHRSARVVTVISSAAVSRRSVTSAVSRPVTM
ncbi:hypothetical protein SMALB_3575 [Streptomyces malaysiensis]|uniref:Uncharacterized protein n=1 Tax=Streptomyces malaysiensis TaxID=92644 RepID=A0A7X6AXR5_STRMQ|nr:hypothetical protein [Streptomyces malaysiensis]